MSFGPEGTELPDDSVYEYEFVDDFEMTYDEIMNLRKSVGLDPDTLARWSDCREQQSYFGGVRAEDVEAEFYKNDLVGMIRLAGDVRHSVVCDIVVHPDHQRKGLGTAMLKEVLAYADRIGVSHLYTDLGENNPMQSTFEALGFVSTGHNLFRTHP